MVVMGPTEHTSVPSMLQAVLNVLNPQSQPSSLQPSEPFKGGREKPLKELQSPLVSRGGCGHARGRLGSRCGLVGGTLPRGSPKSSLHLLALGLFLGLGF